MGDVSIQYQVNRDLLDKDDVELRNKIAKEGWGAQILSCRQPNGHWGRGFYQPKWTSTHYTLLELKNMGIAPGNKDIDESLDLIFTHEWGIDGGINPVGSRSKSDACINGMVLNYASYFRKKEDILRPVVDFLLSQRMADGGFNCRLNHSGATHGSLHTTLSVAEGILEYKKNGYTYRLNELEAARYQADEFMLMHKLFRSDKSGNIIKSSFLQLCHPPRWYYDILKAMDYFRSARAKYDIRMEDALQMIKSKRTPEGTWKLPVPHAGHTHFAMEKPGQSSLWNTLRAMRVLQYYEYPYLH
jgi:hypothetical protein